jgi:hypothetical protein
MKLPAGPSLPPVIKTLHIGQCLDSADGNPAKNREIVVLSKRRYH